MCPGDCADCVGKALIALALISMGASVFLLFPNGQTEYLMDAKISKEALVLSGFWGSGIMIRASTVFCFYQKQKDWMTGVPQVILAAWSMQAAAADWSCCFSNNVRIKMIISVIWSKLAIIGSSICFAVSAYGLIKGPFCLFTTTLSNKTQIQLWDYPFIKRNMAASSESYLYNHSLWTLCEKPQNIVQWNIILFSILMITSSLEILLCVLQLINGLLGCIVGRC